MFSLSSSWSPSATSLLLSKLFCAVTIFVIVVVTIFIIVVTIGGIMVKQGIARGDALGVGADLSVSGAVVFVSRLACWVGKLPDQESLL